MSDPEAIVLGGGIAGVSVAYHLADTHRTLLLEAESQLGAHSTGRSAALFFENYGAEEIRPLSVASRSFFTDPPPGLSDHPLVAPRGAMWLGLPGQEGALEAIAAAGRALGSEVYELTPRQVTERVSAVREEAVVGGLWEPDPMDLDVAAIHQAYLRGFRQRGGRVQTGAAVTGLDREGGTWTVRTRSGDFRSAVVVNAAGAWGDVVAELAGIPPVGLTPFRRTAFTVGGDEAWARWPMVVDAVHSFYFKPDGSQLLCSPADETPSRPLDARPDPLDVAIAIERINEVTTLGIRSVRSEWAGLRTFTADRVMVIGPEPDAPGFYWLVGQGGTGIQTAPAAAEVAASMVREEPVPTRILDAGLRAEHLSARRPTLQRG